MNPYWLEDEAVPRAAPRHEGPVDVAIVGAGITGCSAALRLAAAGLRVRVHDQRAVAEGASGRNGGFALRGGASSYDVARETYGPEQAHGMWMWTERALDRMEELAGDSLLTLAFRTLAQISGLEADRKVRLIEETNPDWKDLYSDICG